MILMISLRSIVIPATCKRVEAQAFIDCYTLERPKLPLGEFDISEDAFC